LSKVEKSRSDPVLGHFDLELGGADGFEELVGVFALPGFDPASGDIAEFVGIIGGDLGKGDAGDIVFRGVESALGYFDGIDGDGGGADSLVDFFRGEQVISGVAEDVEDIFFSEDFEEVLMGPGFIIKLEPDEQHDFLFELLGEQFEIVMIIGRNHELVVGDGQAFESLVAVGLNHILGRKLAVGKGGVNMEGAFHSRRIEGQRED